MQRVWIDEYVWTPPASGKSGDAVPDTVPSVNKPNPYRRQSIHFPHRVRDQRLRNPSNYPGQQATWYMPQDNNGDVNSRLQFINASANKVPTFAQGHVLTLPFGDDEILGAGSLSVGQLTLSQDNCAISIAGIDVPINDASWSSNTRDSPSYPNGKVPAFPVNAAPQRPAGQYNPLSVGFTPNAATDKKAYPLSVARLGWLGLHGEYNGNSDDSRLQPAPVDVYQHFLPTGAPWDSLVGSPYADPRGNAAFGPEEFVATKPYHIPRAAGHTKVITTESSTAANQIFVIDGQRVGLADDGSSSVDAQDRLSVGSFHGRTWLTSCEGATDQGPTTCPVGQTSPAPTDVNNIRIQQRWTHVDPGNFDGSTGMCFFGPAAAGVSIKRLLQVRPTLVGSVFAWPELPASQSGVTTPLSLQLPNPALADPYNGVAYLVPPPIYPSDPTAEGLWATNMCYYLTTSPDPTVEPPLYFTNGTVPTNAYGNNFAGTQYFTLPPLCPPNNGGPCPDPSKTYRQTCPNQPNPNLKCDLCPPNDISPTYKAKSVSFNTQLGVPFNAGVAYSAALASANNVDALVQQAKQKLRNCAASSNPLRTSDPLNVYWAEVNPVDWRFAVQRSTLDLDSGLFGNPTGIWGNFSVNGTKPGDGIDEFTGLIDVAVTGVQLDPSPVKFDILYAVTWTSLYACINPEDSSITKTLASVSLSPNPIQPVVSLGVQWYKVVTLGENYLTADFFVGSPFTQKYQGTATVSDPNGFYGRAGKASSMYGSGCNAVTGVPVDPRNFYVYPKGTTWNSGVPSTDAWSPSCPSQCSACVLGLRMPLWITAGSERVTPTNPKSVFNALSLNATVSCAAAVNLTATTCSTAAGRNCTVACQYPYINGDGGTQHRGVALSPAKCQYPGQTFRRE